MHNTYVITMTVVAALVTAGLRFAPFLIFGKGRQTPQIITYLGKVLPFAIMGMLVVYCMKDVSFLRAPHGIPELLGCAIVALLHIWKRNTLLSIGVGTVSYMLMVQFLF
jgi:branched-subunit amino acid transport protein AzlD